MQRQSFERFYLERIAIGEGCGCAEQAIGMHDMDARSRELALQEGTRTNPDDRWAWFRHIFRRKRPAD